ncbi:alanine racemase [Philodulcilactobacillus myokoensis]|uniref:Alanine racemase n=1 Tax=Philodulcilactobacillus myokoensis TaxID=2929573 RepID=A0A9W6ET76_9LACO|nr:alanine racemase [Philodulcilactobacillus myokoensis]GLB47212.1 alanine racemase [Philodulcilactobacillus myokoensis]
MAIGNHRNASLVVDRKAIYHNIHEAKKRLKDNTDLFMVLKANGYGFGATEVAKVAKKAGASGFCVAILDEALELRRTGFDDPILVLGISRIQDVPLIVKEHVSVTVSSVEWLKNAESVLQDNHISNKLLVHIGLDTGMGRIGFQTPDELSKAIHFMNAHDNIEFEGIFTHFATADSKDDHYFKVQFHRFQKLMQVVKHRPKYVHVSNSATSLWHAACNGNMIRLGASGYGLNPSGRELTPPYHLDSAISLVSEIVYTKKVKKGRSIGYGATYTADCDQWIGTVPIGYADGYSRSLGGFYVLVNGQRCPIVGRICMDQFMIRLPEDVQPGTKVTLIGQDSNQKITLQDIADYCHTINYEVTCDFSRRLPIHYIN